MALLMSFYGGLTPDAYWALTAGERIALVKTYQLTNQERRGEPGGP